MYDSGVTSRYLEAQMRETPSFKAEYHTVDQVRDMTNRLDDAWDPDLKTYTRDLDPEELEFIENERLLCSHDFRYYCSRYFPIIDAETRQPVLLNFNVAQEVVLDVWAEMESKSWAIMMLQLKARRLGVSTESAAAVAHRMQFKSETAAVVASSTPEKSDGLVRIIRDAWDRMPYWLMPRVTRVQDGCPVEFRGHNASLSIQAGNQFYGIGRGQTPSVVHLSEVCEWPDPENDIDSSLLKAILESPEVFFILESTALGRDNWYHKAWRIAKDGWPRGTSKLYPMFLPWYVGRDIYPTTAWLSKHPIAGEWIPDDKLIAHAERAREYVTSHPRLTKHLGGNWVMPREQMWYYTVCRQEDTDKGILNRFLAEMCSDDFDAFQSTNYSAFSTDVILNIHEKIRNPVGVYKLIGVGEATETINPQYRPTTLEIDSSKKAIDIPCRWGQTSLDYRLIPVKFEGYDQSPNAKIYIFEHPRPDFEYGGGVDTGDGIGLDGSVVEMLRKGNLKYDDKQVAEMQSQYINSYSFWPWAYALGTYYSMPVNGQRKQPRMCIDVSRNGEAVQLELRKHGWANFHQWMRLDNKKIRLDRSVKLGFIANAWSRPMMLDMLLTYINNEWLEITSPFFVAEMESFERDEEKQSMRAAFGGHDDRIMALGMILFSFHVLEARGPRMTIAEERAAQKNFGDPVWEPGIQGRAEVLTGDWYREPGR